MTRMQKSVLWVVVGIVVGLVALSLLGGPALAREPLAEADPLTAGINMNSAHYSLNWNVVGTGGGTISSDHFTVSSTLGQPTVGTITSTHFEVCTGYWCWLDRIASIFLPLVMKN